MSNPLGDNHSKRNIIKVAAWIATIPTNIQEAVSKGSRNAVGDIIPVRLATTIAIPVSMKGTLKSTCKLLNVTKYSCKLCVPKRHYLLENILESSSTTNMRWRRNILPQLPVRNLSWEKSSPCRSSYWPSRRWDRSIYRFRLCPSDHLPPSWVRRWNPGPRRTSPASQCRILNNIGRNFRSVTLENRPPWIELKSNERQAPVSITMLLCKPFIFEQKPFFLSLHLIHLLGTVCK